MEKLVIFIINNYTIENDDGWRLRSNLGWAHVCGKTVGLFNEKSIGLKQFERSFEIFINNAMWTKNFSFEPQKLLLIIYDDFWWASLFGKSFYLRAKKRS